MLVESDGTVIATGSVIAEYLDEVYRDRLLIGINPLDRAEVRRLVAWFDVKMDREVTRNLIGEKLMKRLTGQGQPNSTAIRAGHAAIHFHLEYITYLTERRRWLAGDHFSLADIAAAAHLSVLDYAGDVPWDVARARQGLVRPHQIAPELPPHPRRPYPRPSAAQALRRPRFLSQNRNRNRRR